MARDDFEGLVAGDMLPTTMGQFKLRAARIIEEQQALANPDNALIAFACDAIRLAREHGTFYHNTIDSISDAIEKRRARETARETEVKQI